MIIGDNIFSKKINEPALVHELYLYDV